MNEQLDFKLLEDGDFLSSDIKGLTEVSERLLNNFPKSPDALKFAAKVYVRAQNLSAAQQCLEKAIAVNPSDLESLMLLASVYRNSELSAAKKVYDNILLLNPGSEAATRGLKEIRSAD